VISRIPETSLEGVSVAVDARTIEVPGIGFHRYLKAAVTCLLEMRAQVCLLTNFPTQDFELLFPAAEWIGFGSRRNIIWDQYDLPRLLRKRQFDLYWAPTNNGIPFLPVRKTWMISTTHDLVPLRLPNLYLYRRPAFAIPYLVWTIAAMLRSDTVLTVSDASAQDIRRIFRRRSTVISPVFGDILSSAATGPLPEEIRDKTYIVYNGGLDPRKSVPNLLSGFAIATDQWPDLCLVLVGNGYGVFDAPIKSLGISEKVFRTGYVSDETRSAIVKAAAAMAYPSLYEGFGLPLLEAFADGTPVVTAANSSITEVAGNAAVYVDPRDPVSIARGLVQMRDPEIVADLRSKGRKRLASFDPIVWGERLAAELATAARRHEERSSGRGTRLLGC
jgi:glycosyltransferase involved in cell wall biosynthesis